MKFFYISKKADEQIVSGIVMQGTPPELEDNPFVDTQGDWVKMSTLQKTARAWLDRGRFVFDVNHEGEEFEFEVLESFVVDKTDIAIFGIKVKKGAWVLTLSIDDDDVWDKIKSGALAGFSPYGSARSPEN